MAWSEANETERKRNDAERETRAKDATISIISTSIRFPDGLAVQMYYTCGFHTINDIHTRAYCTQMRTWKGKLSVSALVGLKGMCLGSRRYLWI